MSDTSMNQNLDILNQINSSKALNDELMNKQVQQSYEIDEKEKLLNTRNRMLQISYEENMYKKKILYTLLSVLLLFVVLGVVIMVKRKR